MSPDRKKSIQSIKSPQQPVGGPQSPVRLKARQPVPATPSRAPTVIVPVTPTRKLTDFEAHTPHASPVRASGNSPTADEVARHQVDRQLGILCHKSSTQAQVNGAIASLPTTMPRDATINSVYWQAFEGHVKTFLADLPAHRLADTMTRLQAAQNDAGNTENAYIKVILSAVEALPASPSDMRAAEMIGEWAARRRLVGNLPRAYDKSPGHDLKKIDSSDPDTTRAKAARDAAKDRTKEMHDSIVGAVSAFNPHLLKEAGAAFIVLKATMLTEQFLRYSEHSGNFQSPRADAEIAAQLRQYASNMAALLAKDKFSAEQLEELRDPLEILKRAVRNDPSWTRHIGALLTRFDELSPPPGPPEDEPPDEAPPLPKFLPPLLLRDKPPPLPKDAAPALRGFELPSPEFPPPPPLGPTQRNLASEFAAAGPGGQQAGARLDLESLMAELDDRPGELAQRIIDTANDYRVKVVQPKAAGRPGDAVSSTSAQQLAKHLTTMLLDGKSPWSSLQDVELRKLKSALDTLSVPPEASIKILDLVGWRKWEMKQELLKQVKTAHEAILLGATPWSEANKLMPHLDRMVRRWKALDGGLPAGASTDQAFRTSLINEALESANLQVGRDRDVQTVAVAALREACGLV